MAVQLDDGGGRGAAPPRRGARPRRAHRRRGSGGAHDRRRPGRRAARSPRATTSTPTWSCSPPASGPATSSAASAGLEVGERGGVVVDDALRHVGARRLRDRRGRLPRRPGLRPRRARATRWPRSSPTASPAATATFTGADLSTTLKLLGVDVASVGNPHADGDEVVRRRPGDRHVAEGRPRRRRPGARRRARRRHRAVRRCWCRPCGARSPPPDVLELLRPTGGAGGAGPADLPDEAGVCSCHNVSCGADPRRGRRGLRGRRRRQGAARRPAPAAARACPVLQELDRRRARASRARSSSSGCAPHFAMTRPELFEVVRVDAASARSPSSSAATARAAAARSASRPWRRCSPRSSSGYILDGEQASLQDTNDHFLANIQRDGTYSVVPRVPGRRDHPGAADRHRRGRPRLRPLHARSPAASASTCSAPASSSCPRSGRGCVDAGLESGHAYGKAVRTVKSCVGTTWCRYGVQDSVQMAIDLELRYRGLRSPHKIKLAVSGCARECAEAQSKDVGVIATERGWNLYVGGNGGMRPAHAELLAEDLDDDDARPLDRPLPDVVRPHRRAAGAHGDLAAQAARRHRLRAPRRDRRRARHRRRARGRHGPPRRRATSASGRRRSTTPSAWPASSSFVNTDEPDPTVTRVEVRGQRIPAGATMTAIDEPRSRRAVDGSTAGSRSAPLDRLTPDRGVAALVDGRAGGRVPPRRRRRCTPIDNVDPCSGASVLSRGLVGDVDGVADRRVADVQAALRPAHRAVPRRPRRRRSRSTTCASSTASSRSRLGRGSR